MSKGNFISDLAKKFKPPNLRHPPLKSSKTPPPPGKPPTITNSYFANGDDMGKSNKFDYTNRSNSGAKLGQIVGTALQKEAEKVKKDAERHMQKARKQSGDSSAGSVDTPGTTHTIDLKAPSKDLGDDGVCALADGLEISLRNGSDVASLALEDLNLSANGITTVSLARLAPIIELAKYDLKTLNLSHNKIRVKTNDEAQQWETFLRAFKDCLKLRRLDLSSNPELGARAMEVFARVHTGERPINPMPPGGESSTLSLISEHNDDDTTQSPEQAPGADRGGLDFSTDMAHARLIKRRCGLRSIPFITLHDIGLDDAGALWLSYVLEEHHYPTQLIDELNATHIGSSVLTYQQDTNFRGMDWNENKAIGKEGRQLLEKTELIRRHILFDGRATAASPIIEGGDSLPGDDERARRRSMDSRISTNMQGNRRASIRSIRTSDGGEHEVPEFESARKKIMRHIIAHDGAGDVELWKSALRLFRASRVMLYVAPVTRRCYIGKPFFNIPDMDIPATPTIEPPTPVESPVANEHPHLTLDTAKAASLALRDRASYAAKLSAAANGAGGQPEGALTDVTNTPATPLRLQKPTHRKGAFSEGTDLPAVTEKLRVPMQRGGNPLRFVRFQQARLAKYASEGKGFRNVSTPCHFPSDIMDRIVSFVMVNRELGVMSDEQRRRAMDWGLRKETLMTEREWLKKDESAQVLMLLDNVGCLAYRQ